MKLGGHNIPQLSSILLIAYFGISNMTSLAVIGTLQIRIFDNLDVHSSFWFSFESSQFSLKIQLNVLFYFCDTVSMVLTTWKYLNPIDLV